MNKIKSDENLSLFDMLEEDQLSFNNAIEVVKVDFLEAEMLSWETLFEGFDKLYAITYSSSIDFICKLLKKFNKAEIIFGCSGVISDNLHEVIAFQTATMDMLHQKFSENESDLLSRIDKGTLRLLVLREQLSHEKIYLLESEDGRKRVINGSANMSNSAFLGKQRENLCYMDGGRAFEYYYGVFEELRENSSDYVAARTLRAVERNDNENLEELPIAQTIKAKKIMSVEHRSEVSEETRFVLNVKNNSGKYKQYIPQPDKSGKIKLTAEIFKQIRRSLDEDKVKKKELRSEYPQLVADIENQIVTLNDTQLNLNPSEGDIRHDVSLFLDYMNGYEKFHGDTQFTQIRYFEFANWLFTTPFLALLRNIAISANKNNKFYPVFGIVYGPSNAGKTSFLETLLKMMIGQKPKISASDFTKTKIEQIRREVKGAPVIVDDMRQARYREYAVEAIKNDDFGCADGLMHYPAVVISANEDLRVVDREVLKRAISCRTQIRITRSESIKLDVVRQIQNNIGTAFYREYMRQMLHEMPDIIERLKSDEDMTMPDILAISSTIIYNIIKKHYDKDIPFYARELTMDDYLDEKITAAQAIQTIWDAWKVNSNKLFIIDKKLNQLRYNAGEKWSDAEQILKELPEYLEARKSHEWIIMDLDKSCEFFEINFRKKRNIFK